MSQNLGAHRSSPKGSPTETLTISTESGNVSYGSSQNLILDGSCGALRDFTAGQRTIIIARFWGKVKKTESCWLWTASVTGSRSVRYGQFKLPRLAGARRQGHVYPHRLSWELAYGPIPDGLGVCHKCDNPICVRPEHLFLGTQADNLQDASRKGRLHLSRKSASLTLADRLAIYHMPERRGLTVELAIRYCVSKACISIIRAGKFVGSPFDQMFVRVPHVNVPVRGEVA